MAKKKGQPRKSGAGFVSKGWRSSVDAAEAAVFSNPGEASAFRRWMGVLILWVGLPLAFVLQFVAGLFGAHMLGVFLPYLVAVGLGLVTTRQAVPIGDEGQSLGRILKSFPRAVGWKTGVASALSLVPGLLFWLAGADVLGSIALVYTVAGMSTFALTRAALESRRAWGKLRNEADAVRLALGISLQDVQRTARPAMARVTREGLDGEPFEQRERVTLIANPPAAATLAIAKNPERVDWVLSQTTKLEAEMRGNAIVFKEAGQQTLLRRQFLAESDGTIVGSEPGEDERSTILRLVSPAARRDAVEAYATTHLDGAEIIEWEPQLCRAVAKRFTPEEIAKRAADQALLEAIAAIAMVPAHELSLEDGEDGVSIHILLTPRAYKRLSGDLDGDLVRGGLSHLEGVLRATPNERTRGSDCWLTLFPVTVGTLVRRELIESSAGRVIAVDEVGADTVLTLAHGVSPADEARVSAWCERELRKTLTEWDPHNRRAVAAVPAESALKPIVKAVRDRIAPFLKVEPQRLNVEVIEGAEHVEQVIIRKAPPVFADPAKRRELRKHIMLSLPDGTNGWREGEDQATGDWTFVWGPPRALPKTVPGLSILPACIDANAWSQLTFGVTERGAPAAIDLKAGPHALVVGGTGSGKTYTTRMLLLAAYGRGFEVIIIDPTKRAAGLRAMDPYAKIVATASKQQAADVLGAVYDEVQHRVDLTEEHQVEGWRSLPAHLGIRPWFVVIDEYAGLIEPDLARPSDRKSEEFAEYEAEQATIAAIRSRVSKLAAEARSAGIHLCIITQTAYAEILGGKMRQNLGTVIQLIPPKKPTPRSQLAMIFPPEDVQGAEEAIVALNDGHSPGFAVAAVEGASVEGLRVGLIVNEKADPEKGTPAVEEDIDYLRRLGVPFGVPLVIESSAPISSPTASATRGSVNGRRIIEPAAPVHDDTEVDLGVIDIDFDGLFDDTPAPDPWAVAAAARAELTADSQPQAVQMRGAAVHVVDDELFGVPRRVIPVEDGF